jgi:hypothetical protein
MNGTGCQSDMERKTERSVWIAVVAGLLLIGGVFAGPLVGMWGMCQTMMGGAGGGMMQDHRP